MTQEQKRIKIAEACGFSNINSVCWRGNVALHERQIPNYPEDLNAMHEAEKVLIDRGNWSMCDYDRELTIMTSSWKWNATAAQRAEAFGLTLNLWK